jgi:hypothetical protein
MVNANLHLHIAILAFIEIKAAVHDFERGDKNLPDSLERIRAALSLTDAAEDHRREAASRVSQTGVATSW